MTFIISLLISAVSIIATAYLLPGVKITSFGTSIVVALVLGLLNVIVKPILVLLTLPINILTLGLFTFVINVFILLLASKIVPGFTIDGFVSALLFSIVLSIISSILGNIA